MPIVYILQSQTNDKLYTGSSRDDDENSRLKAHNSGKTRSTKSGRPWILKHKEYYKAYTEARKREIFPKSGQGRKQIQSLLGL